MTESANKLKTERTQLLSKMEKIGQHKKTLENDIMSLRSELKTYGSRIEEQKKRSAKTLSDLTREKASFDNKEKQFLAEIRKKDSTIKLLQDRLQSYQLKTQKKAVQPIINSIEVTGEILKSGPSFYTSSTGDFLKMINETDSSNFEKLRKDNHQLREALFELQSMMTEIVNIRKAVLERSLGGISYEENHFLTELKQELFNASGITMGKSTLLELRENTKRFKSFMDKLDSFKFNINLDQSFGGEDDREIEDIKNIRRLKDLLSKLTCNLRKLQICG